jgi:hypothetical protein
VDEVLDLGADIGEALAMVAAVMERGLRVEQERS